jgi:hypothetical protein
MKRGAYVVGYIRDEGMEVSEMEQGMYLTIV